MIVAVARAMVMTPFLCAWMWPWVTRLSFLASMRAYVCSRSSAGLILSSFEKMPAAVRPAGVPTAAAK